MALNYKTDVLYQEIIKKKVIPRAFGDRQPTYSNTELAATITEIFDTINMSQLLTLVQREVEKLHQEIRAVIEQNSENAYSAISSIVLQVRFLENKPFADGHTPLTWTAYKGCYEAYRFLCIHFRTRGKDNHTALYWAEQSPNADIRIINALKCDFQKMFVEQLQSKQWTEKDLQNYVTLHPELKSTADAALEQIRAKNTNTTTSKNNSIELGTFNVSVSSSSSPATIASRTMSDFTNLAKATNETKVIISLVDEKNSEANFQQFTC